MNEDSIYAERDAPDTDRPPPAPQGRPCYYCRQELAHLIVDGRAPTCATCARRAARMRK